MSPSSSSSPRSGHLDVERIDLRELTRGIDARVPGGARVGKLAGRTAFRDATVAMLGCSELAAEQLVDTLVARRFLVFDAHRRGWYVRFDAA